MDLGSDLTQSELADVLQGLAGHYPRPALSQSATNRVLLDWLEDLQGATLPMLEDAVRRYRRSEDNRFYPTSGALLALMREDIRDRHADRAALDNAIALVDEALHAT